MPHLRWDHGPCVLLMRYYSLQSFNRCPQCGRLPTALLLSAKLQSILPVPSIRNLLPAKSFASSSACMCRLQYGYASAIAAFDGSSRSHCKLHITSSALSSLIPAKISSTLNRYYLTVTCSSQICICSSRSTRSCCKQF